MTGYAGVCALLSCCRHVCGGGAAACVCKRGGAVNLGGAHQLSAKWNSWGRYSVRADSTRVPSFSIITCRGLGLLMCLYLHRSIGCPLTITWDVRTATGPGKQQVFERVCHPATPIIGLFRHTTPNTLSLQQYRKFHMP